ncbi:MAG: hypothetical protein PHR82_00880 [Endomicrobiaceae bacterium]|nr:hypothetical protein [Endomicrobiaceae bacterium]
MVNKNVNKFDRNILFENFAIWLVIDKTKSNINKKITNLIDNTFKFAKL